jgi:hypothetical protein
MGVAELWLDGFGRLMERAAHEIRNPLNAAVLGVQVIRQRTERPELSAGSLRTFAESAAGELDRAVTLIDAMLTLARPTRIPVDLAEVARPLAVLVNAAEAASVSPRLKLEVPGTASTITASDGSAVRLVLLAAFQEGLRCDETATAEVTGSTFGPTVTVRCTSSVEPPPSPVCEAARAAGILIEPMGPILRLSFPA